MRFFEIAAQKAAIVATKRFMKNTATYLRGGYPGLAKTLREFLDFKAEHPLSSFGPKDKPFANATLLRGLWHAHLVHGKVIVIYSASTSRVILYDMVEHSAFDTKTAQAAIEKFAHGVSATDLTPVALQNQIPTLSPSVKKELDDLLYEMSVQDRDILTAALQGHFEDLMEFLRLVAPEVPDSTIIDGFGGATGLQDHIRQILKQMGVG